MKECEKKELLNGPRIANSKINNKAKSQMSQGIIVCPFGIVSNSEIRADLLWVSIFKYIACINLK